MRRMRALRPYPAILMYHRIADEAFDPWGLSVSPDRFGEQVRWLSKSRRVLPLEEFAARHAQRSLPANAIALTFDDGYACVAKIAAPMLDEANVPATIFIPSEVIESGKRFWWDELERIVLDFEGDSIELEGTVFELGPPSAEDRVWKPNAEPGTPRQAAFLRLWNHLRHKAPEELSRAMNELRDQSRLEVRDDFKRPMTPNEVRSVCSDKIQFGSHSLSHPSLPRLPRAQKRTEIQESLDRCEALTGRRPRAFAYPFGEFDRESETLVEQAGFTCACTAKYKAATPESRRYALPRLMVGNITAGTLKRVVRYAPR